MAVDTEEQLRISIGIHIKLWHMCTKVDATESHNKKWAEAHSPVNTSLLDTDTGLYWCNQRVDEW